MHPFLPRKLAEGLEALSDLALDLRWTWSHANDSLWRRLDPELWARAQNPWAILQNTAQSSLSALAADPAFRSALARAVAERERYAGQQRWCTRFHPDLSVRPIAYFSMEFGLSEAIPLYAGGLGILAGDLLKTASDLGVPVVGVGLLYQEGYFRQMLDPGGWQREAYPYNDPTVLPIQPVVDREGAWLRVRVDLPGRAVHLRVWQATVGGTRLYLLDSNCLMNGAGDRGITAKLYGGGSETRLLQEIVLGIGGWTVLEELGIGAEVCHLNEGHAAFAVIERAARFMRRTATTFAEAWWATRAGNVFTTHTPVAAGFDAFAPDLIERYFRDRMREIGVGSRAFLGLGRTDPDDEREPFNMATLALRGCARANGVSRLHAEVSRGLFRRLYPRWPVAEVPVAHVTNGVHVPSWDSQWADALWTGACGKGRWLGTGEDLAQAIRGIDDETLWQLAADERSALVAYARERLAWQLAQRGAAKDTIDAAARALDPNTLTLGFARRFAAYKRPNLLLRDPQRLARLLTNPRRPVQILVAGKAHPDDADGKRLVRAWLEFAGRADVRASAVFLEDYDIALAQMMVQGVDLWINTPRRPMEACGTSGMKVLANGGLNLSTRDGWWAEAHSPEVGWAIGDAAPPDGDAEAADAADADALYRTLEEDAVPMFYDRDERGIPRAWIARMRASIASLAPRFSSNRMLQEYLEGYYVPAAAAFRRRAEGGAALAKQLRAWHDGLAAGWHTIHFGEVSARRDGDDWCFDVPAYLAEVSAESVRVELYAEAEPGFDRVRHAMERGAPITGARNGYLYSGRVPASRPHADYTPRIVPHHPEALTPAEASLVLWQR